MPVLPYNAVVTPHPLLAARLRRHSPAWFALVLALAAGCEKPETVRQYDTPRSAPRAVAVDADEVRKLLDHMFAAIVPAGGKAWFFKLVVPAPAAEEMGKKFDDFLATVDAKPNAAIPAWTLPEGWTAAEGGNEMRAATITIPHGDDKFEITVSTLPLAGEWPAFLQVNVDRWMDQLGQPHLTGPTVEKLARTTPTKGSKATVLELVGKMQTPMGMAGGMPAGHPPITGGAASTSPPPDSTAGGDAAGAGSSAPGKLAYVTPTGWKPGPMVVMGMSREAAFVIPTDGGKAEVAVTKFPATTGMADLGMNVRRWAGQVGVESLTDDDIRGAAKTVEVDGEPALRFEFNSPEGAATPLSIVAIMAKRGNEVWFVKLWGDRPAVESQGAAFDKFLQSIKLTGS